MWISGIYAEEEFTSALREEELAMYGIEIIQKPVNKSDMVDSFM